ncbi:hypothetical protein [Pseudomonas grandcourensis]|uniref:hypothetical protein n=1 Tax=Pseudomonas grandcourensis TaxID=3136736 RepID=UPI00326792EC
MTDGSSKPTRISTFKVQFDGGAGIRSKKIYANGRMQVRVQVLLAAADENGKNVVLPPSVYLTVRLINYKTGELLGDGWEASAPNRFSQALYNIPLDWKDEPSPVDPYTRVITYWVSSTVALDVQVGAVVILNDKVIRTNGTTAGYSSTNSVTIEAQPPVSYDLAKFSLSAVKRNPLPATTVSHFYLGLNVDGKQIELVGWSSRADAGINIFSRSHSVFEARGYYLDSTYWWRSVCHIAGVDEAELFLVLPPEFESNRPQIYPVPVNDKKGVLSIVQGVTLDFTADKYVGKTGVFCFAVYDVYGNAHDLCLRFDDSVIPGSFVLDNG